MIRKANSRFEDLKRFLAEDMWLLDTESLTKTKQRLLNLVKFSYIVGKGYAHDKCSLHASALAFITLLSIIPVLALSMSVADLLGFGTRFTDFISRYQEGVPPQVQEYIVRIINWVQQTDFLALGIIGIFFLLWIYIRAMAKLELIIDNIWGVKSKRRLLRKVSLYIGLMFLVTALLIVATSMMAAIPGREFLSRNGNEVATTAFDMVMSNLSIIGIIAALMALYILLPNTRVNYQSAAAGAIVAGIMWLGWQKLCIHFQLGISSYDRFFGAFASIPIALYWMYVNWAIILLGAEISFAWQNFNTFSLEMESDDVSQALRRRLAFHMVYDVCLCFKRGNGYWNSRTFQSKTKVPIRLVNSLLETLKDENILVELGENDSWVPARDMSQITMKDIETACRGKVDGKFKHIGELPGVVADILSEHELAYFKDLEKRNFAQLIDQNETLEDPELKSM